MAETSPTDEELTAWRLAHRQLTAAVNEAKERVNTEKIKRRSLLEAICKNITTEGKITSTSKWEVAPMFQPAQKAKAKAKRTKSNGSSSSKKDSGKNDVSSTGASSKDDGTDGGAKKAKPKGKPRLKMKLKPLSKVKSENETSEGTTMKKKGVTNQSGPEEVTSDSFSTLSSRGKKRPKENDSNQDQNLSKIQKIDPVTGDMSQAEDIVQQQQQIESIHNQQMMLEQQQLQLQQFELERQQQQQYQQNNVMGMNYYQPTPENFVAAPMGSQAVDTAMMQQTLLQQQQQQQQQQMMQQQQQQIPMGFIPPLPPQQHPQAPQQQMLSLSQQLAQPIPTHSDFFPGMDDDSMLNDL